MIDKNSWIKILEKSIKDFKDILKNNKFKNDYYNYNEKDSDLEIVQKFWDLIQGEEELKSSDWTIYVIEQINSEDEHWSFFEVIIKSTDNQWNENYFSIYWEYDSWNWNRLDWIELLEKKEIEKEFFESIHRKI